MRNETFLLGDCRETLKGIDDGIVQTCITSPPYFGLRDYGCGDQIGLEENPEAFVAGLVDVFREVKRVLRDDGTLWLNLGDSYAAARGGTHQPAETLAGGIGGKTLGGEKVNRDRCDGYNPSRNAKAIGLKHKDLIGIPWRVAFALQAGGWYLRQDIIWHKPNPMPESVTDRCTKAHEYIFLLSKSQKYFYNADAIKEPTSGMDDRRNKRSVWPINTATYKDAHFATYPPALITPCVLAGSRPGDIVLDPFTGAGTTALVAKENSRRFIGCELNPEYLEIAKNRIANATPGLGL